MADWTKKISKVAGSTLQPGEQVREGILCQPSGLTSQLMARSIGGIAGAAIASKLRTKDDGTIDSTSGIAGTVPDGPIAVGLTDRRVLVYSFAKMTGKPKDLLLTMPASDLAAVDVQKGTAAHKVTLMFADGTGKTFEVPRIGNDPEAFAAAVSPG